ncbi:hypothetical protein KIH27_18020 [Mycobacterium sp. M1]|uniref:Uncharacterized protein n=1 Tax=Mycolicibacter acidiphilus TaxID=2835306 RepID=A0ABS5RME6_9MYCO|nr:hypothetical protein [Mycolicibacter acidiphilus]MBS9535486.1 hypothetical protein [Mycolicibacter acidiphilus]
MAGLSDGLFEPALPVRRSQAAGVPAMTYLLCLLAVLALGAVVTAAALGQSTVALCTALLSGAFFAGRLC